MNVILISIDNLRFDCVGYQQDKRELIKYDVAKYLETPTLDGLAEKSVCFTNCFSTNTYTTSSHASIFTGLYPPKHGVRAFFHTKLNPSVNTLAEIFKTRGYETVMSTDVPELFSPFDLNRGFNHMFIRDDQALFEFLRQANGKKILLFIHFFDVHTPYLYSEAPGKKEYNGDYFLEMGSLFKRFGLGEALGGPHSIWNKLSNAIGHDIKILFPLYVKGVSKFDKGRFRSFVDGLDSAGYLDGNLIAIFSDHGEGTCSYGSSIFHHGGDLFDNVLRVPLIINHPDISQKTSESIVSTVDIFPTILELSGIDIEYEIDGIFMNNKRENSYSETWCGLRSPYIIDGETDEPTLNYSGTEWLLRQRCIRTTSKKFILCGQREEWLDDVLNNSGHLFTHRLYRYIPPFIRKFFLRHKSNNSLNNIFGLPNREFVRELYRTVLSRFEDPKGFKHHVKLLEFGKRTKQEVLLDFLNSNEYKNTSKYVVYDLEKDPFEEHPLNPNPSYDYGVYTESQKHYNYILQLEGDAVQTENIWEKEKAMARLRELGYF